MGLADDVVELLKQGTNDRRDMTYRPVDCTQWLPQLQQQLAATGRRDKAMRGEPARQLFKAWLEGMEALCDKTMFPLVPAVSEQGSQLVVKMGGQDFKQYE